MVYQALDTKMNCIKGLQTPSGHATSTTSGEIFFSVVFLEHVLQAILAHTHANWGCVAIFSNAEKFRCLYSYYIMWELHAKESISLDCI